LTCEIGGSYTKKIKEADNFKVGDDFESEPRLEAARFIKPRRRSGMNLAGKILTVSIFILSVIFMTVVLAIFVAHQNWRDEILRSPEQATAANRPGLKYRWDEGKKLCFP